MKDWQFSITLEMNSTKSITDLSKNNLCDKRWKWKIGQSRAINQLLSGIQSIQVHSKLMADRVAAATKAIKESICCGVAYGQLKPIVDTSLVA